MKNRLLLLILLSVSWIGFSSLVLEDGVELPIKKINKAVTKIWKVDEFKVIEDDLNNQKNSFENGCWLKVESKGKDLGMVYVGRVNSCNAGGCSIEPTSKPSLSFEFFDYFLLLDNSGEVLWVKVYNYQATQGHEVMSRGWLNQFKGLTKNEKLVFGQDIETISGATVSASAITADIQHVLSCLTKF